MNRTHSTTGGRAASAVAPLTLADLWEQLVWPRLLEAPRLALRPARVGLAFVFLIGVAAIVGGSDLIDGQPNRAVLGDYLSSDAGLQVSALHKGLVQTDANRIGTAVRQALIAGPGRLISQSPWMVVVTVPLLLVWTVVFGGAISRMAACDHAHGLRITWPQGLGFATGKWMSLFGAMAVPPILIWLKCLALAAGAWALFGVPVLNVVGGLGWGLFLLGGLVVTVIALAYVLGHSMLVPAVTCESADAVDAVQCAYAYVLARPMRLVMYIAILVVQAAVITVVATLVVRLVQDVTIGAANEWAGQQAQRVIAGETGLEGTARPASWLVGLWSAMPGLLLSAYLVSLYWCSATMLFLAMRRVCDGQDTSEIWMPGMEEGTMAGETPRT